MNKFDNQSDAQLADDFGAQDAIEKAAKAKKDDIKAELIRRGRAHCAGERFSVSISEQSSTRLDTDALRKKHPKICANFEKVTHSTVARVKAVRAEEVA
ncbi:MAG: hypothetical protein ACRCTG_14525 [Aestuariivirga sp.]